MAESVHNLLFEKCYIYRKGNTGGPWWCLPNASELFKENYQLESLEKLKRDLNVVKNKLNGYSIDRWSKHTRYQDPASNITTRLKNETNAEFVTIAWCKIYECFGKFPESIRGPQLNSLHLCEAPGAFITSLNHYLYTNFEKNEVRWNWLASTLNPYHEGNPSNKMIMDDRFIFYTLDKWLFHKDFTGNIINNKNLEHMQQQCKERLGDVHVITADGSIDCLQSPDCQEEMVAPLHYAEIATALTILAEGGSFIIKMFTMFEASSVSMLFLLNCAFAKVCVFKPCTSKRGNSEVYVICINYKKNVKHLTEILEQMKLNISDSQLMPLFAKNALPSEFLLEHELCCRMFKSYQETAIELNIYTFQTEIYDKSLHTLKRNICNEFYRRYKIQKLPEELRILYKTRKYLYSSYNHQIIYKGSHKDREEFKKTNEQQKILEFHKRLNELKTEIKNNSEQKIKYEKEEDEEPEVSLKIYKGQGVTHLNSSSFANINLLIMRLELNELFKDKLTTDSLWFQQPRVEFHDDNSLVTINYNSNNFTLSNANFSLQQKMFFKDLISNLLKAKPKQIKFINMPFLTHYSVSILRYLSNLPYTEIIFGFEPLYEITLTSVTPDFTNSLEKLALDLFSSSDQDILCCVNIFLLHRNRFNTNLYEFNNMLLLQNFENLIKSFSNA